MRGTFAMPISQAQALRTALHLTNMRNAEPNAMFEICIMHPSGGKGLGRRSYLDVTLRTRRHRRAHP